MRIRIGVDRVTVVPQRVRGRIADRPNSRRFFKSMLTAFAVLLATPTALAAVAISSLQGRVTDATGTLSPDRRNALEAKLAAFERDNGSQIAVLLVLTTRPETIEQYGIRVAEAWKIGRKGD